MFPNFAFKDSSCVTPYADCPLLSEARQTSVYRGCSEMTGNPVLASKWRVYVHRPLKQPTACFASTMYIIEFLPQIFVNHPVPTLASIDEVIFRCILLSPVISLGCNHLVGSLDWSRELHWCRPPFHSPNNLLTLFKTLSFSGS